MIETLKEESLKLFNFDFELLGIISNYESFIYQRWAKECGTFELHINKEKKSVDKLNENMWFMLGNNKEKCFLIDTIEETYSEGNTTLVIKGTDLKGLMKRRITYTDNFDRVDKTQAENVMKHYITNHFIDSKLAVEPYTALTERNMLILEVATTQNRGIETVWQSRFENVHDVEKHIAEDTGLNWKVYADFVKKKFVFDVFEGTDRTLEQKQVPQILFCKSRQNLKESRKYKDLSGFKNVAYAGGKGENEDRPVVVKGTDTGIDRREIFIDLNNISDMDELNTEAEKKLKDYKKVITIEGQVYSTTNMEYEKDWFIGDKITLIIGDIKENKYISGVKEIYERNNLNIEVTFGDKTPSLIDEIKKKEGVVE